MIFASSIGDQSGKTSNAWHGIIFEGDADGIIYGESVAPTDDFTIPTGKTLTIPSGLTAATSYTFYARYQANGFYKGTSTPSGLSDPTYTAYAAPSTNEGDSIDYAAETVSAAPDYEVRLNDTTDWTTGSVSIRLPSWMTTPC